MSKPIRILGIAGSLRKKSYNRSALAAAAKLVPEGAEIEIFEIDGFPGFNEDDEQNPPAKVVEFKQKIREADAILFVTPEYNYSVPGVLKNAIDWASRPYGDSAWTESRQDNGSLDRFDSDRPRAISPAAVDGFFDMFPINQPEVMIGNCANVFDENGDLTDETTKGFIRDMLQNLVDWTVRIRPEGRAESN